MGLDIYFHKRTFNQHNPNKPIKENENGEKEYEQMPEVAYFRKVNFLMSFFNYYAKCEAQGNMEGDCCYVPISRYEVKELIDACDETLKMRLEIEERQRQIEKEKAEGKEVEIDYSDVPLQPESGFFFGSTDFDEWFFNDVEEVLKTFRNILEDLKDDEELFMYAWW